MKVHGRKRNTVCVDQLNCPIPIVGLQRLPRLVHINQQLASIMILAILLISFLFSVFCLSFYFYFPPFPFKNQRSSFYASVSCPFFLLFFFLIYFLLLYGFFNQIVKLILELFGTVFKYHFEYKKYLKKSIIIISEETLGNSLGRKHF